MVGGIDCLRRPDVVSSLLTCDVPDLGDVYLGLDIKTGDYVAIKVESTECADPQLRHEARVYQLLQGGRGVP